MQKSSMRIFSGIQPTGFLHIGNYLGAIKNWVDLQNHYPSAQILYCIVDHHSLTDKYRLDHDLKFESTLKTDIYNMAAYLLASGIDPQKSILFLQSHVPEHAELSWILSCLAPMNWLNKMTQYKDKKTKASSLGLFIYPVLMAADILLYRANKVPVGEDQKQHIELTRDYAVRFNSLFCKKDQEFFPVPQYMESKIPRVLSLRDGVNKMSKSDKNDMNRINLNDEPEVVYDKIIKAKTDSLPKIKYEENRPELANLIRIFASFQNKIPEDVAKEYQNSSMKEFKEALAHEISSKIYPISLKAEEMLEDKEKILEILESGGLKAREIAVNNMKQIKKIMNFA